MSTSIFEIIGPVMLGPSSSHTAGMARIGKMAYHIAGEELKKIYIRFSPMLRNTYRGHRSDVAFIGGILGMSEDDVRIKDSIVLAKQKGIDIQIGFLPKNMYPQNTVWLEMECKSGRNVSLMGTSIGGGSIVIHKIDDVFMKLVPEQWHILIWSKKELVLHMEGFLIQYGKTKTKFITCISMLHEPSKEILQQIQKEKEIHTIRLIPPVLSYGSTILEQTYDSCAEICKKSKEQKIAFGDIAMCYEMERSGFSKEVVYRQMSLLYQKMKESATEAAKKPHRLLYGLASGTDGKALRNAVEKGKTISGKTIPMAVSIALEIMEYNASMGTIVAAPTAGSSGIVPGCFITVQKKYGFSDEEMVKALFVSGLIGVIMSHRQVSFSGSVGGCQAEVGVSAAITAAGLVSLFTDDAEQIVQAMAICLKNLLGLVCDPIAGPIEIPCIKRNAIGTANAFISADMAMAGIRSFIPPDEVIDALVDVEKRLPQELKCATSGGLACTQTAKAIRKKIK